jgi:hypothetical protein
MTGQEGIQKYIELYELSKRGMDEELQGIRRLEEKASNYMSVLGLLLAASGLGGPFVFAQVLPIKTWLDALSLGAFLCFFASVFLAILSLFRVIKTENLLHFPVNDDLIKHFEANSYLDAVFALTRSNIQAVQANRQVRSTKIRRLTMGYRIMIFSITTLFVFTLSMLSRSLSNAHDNNTQKSGDTQMPPNSQDSDSSKGSPAPKDSADAQQSEVSSKPVEPVQVKPDLNVVPPKYDVVAGKDQIVPNPNVSAPKYELFQESYDPTAGKSKSESADESSKTE